MFALNYFSPLDNVQAGMSDLENLKTVQLVPSCLLLSLGCAAGGTTIVMKYLFHKTRFDLGFRAIKHADEY